MRKLSLTLLIAVPCMEFGFSQQDMSHAMCKDMRLTSKTTLQEVKDNCRISEQELSSKGIFEVTLNNDTTNEEIVCMFPDRTSSSVLTGCK